MISVFCDVIDNYGDAGFCLRLCRDLCNKKYQVRFFCNNLNTLKQIYTKEDQSNPLLEIKTWPSNSEDFTPTKVIIQAFSVRLPSQLNQKIKEANSLVINLDYLTAEKFAEDCHKLSSFADGIQSYFFFPGFTNKTGGLIIENNLLRLIKEEKGKETSKISLFSYENERLPKIISLLNKLDKEFDVQIFEGKTLDNFNKVFKHNLEVNKVLKNNKLTYKAIKMVNQDEYDSILLNSDLNLVRGEDSIVRAMLIGKPFLWNIYPQKDNYHITKIEALFDLMKIYCTNKQAVEKLRSITLFYNGADINIDQFDICYFCKEWKDLSKEWSNHLISLGSLTDNLIAFLKEKINLTREISH